MLKTEKIKTHVMFPSDLLKAIDKTVGGRKRSKFIVEAAEKRLADIRIQKALEATAGCWKDENHPDMRGKDGAYRAVRKLRQENEKTLRGKLA